MINIFNRRELITVISMEKLFHVKDALANAGIPCYTKTYGMASAASTRKHGAPFINQDAAYTYTIFVHRSDYDRAFLMIQPALRK